jgi:HAD superfamily hydrolase (TIGR01484 family)
LDYKLLFVDIDGTIFDHSTQSIHPTTIYALQKVKESNIKVILSSGRNYSMAKELGVISAINIDGGVFLNGAITYYDSKIINASVLDEATLYKIRKFAQKYHLN